MTTEEQTFDAELSIVFAFLNLYPADWCVTDYEAERLDVAVATENLAPFLADLAAEGFRVQANRHAQLARADGRRLRLNIFFTMGCEHRTSGAAPGCVFGRTMPVNLGNYCWVPPGSAKLATLAKGKNRWALAAVPPDEAQAPATAGFRWCRSLNGPDDER